MMARRVRLNNQHGPSRANPVGMAGLSLSLSLLPSIKHAGKKADGSR